MDRSISASAGEPPRMTCRKNTLRVYPRKCGGTRRVMLCPVGKSGLSPQVRGNLRG